MKKKYKKKEDKKRKKKSKRKNEYFLILNNLVNCLFTTKTKHVDKNPFSFCNKSNYPIDEKSLINFNYH